MATNLPNRLEAEPRIQDNANFFATLKDAMRLIARTFNTTIDYIKEWRTLYDTFVAMFSRITVWNNPDNTWMQIAGPKPTGGVNLALTNYGNTSSVIYGQRNDLNKWAIELAGGPNADNFYIHRYNAAGNWKDSPFALNWGQNIIALTAQAIEHSAQGGWTVYRMRALSGQGNSFEFWDNTAVRATFYMGSDLNMALAAYDNGGTGHTAFYVDHNTAQVVFPTASIQCTGVTNNDSINAVGTITTNRRFYSGGWEGLWVQGTNGDGANYVYQDAVAGNPQWANVFFRPWLQINQWGGFMMAAAASPYCEIQFRMSGASYGTVCAAAFSVISDEREKVDVALLPAQHDAFMRIAPISWKWPERPAPKDDEITLPADTQEHWGYSAQNIALHVPLAVTGSVLAQDADGKPLAASVDPIPITALTVLEVQALWNRITQLETRITELESA